MLYYTLFGNRKLHSCCFVSVIFPSVFSPQPSAGFAPHQPSVCYNTGMSKSGISAQEKKTWMWMKLVWFLLSLLPVVVFIAAYLLKERGVPSMTEEEYGQGMPAVIQYILFAVGATVFFFIDGMSHTLARYLFGRDKTGTGDDALPGKYAIYISLSLLMLFLITLSASWGFLLCGNLVWLGLFAGANLSLVYKYYPSPRNLSRLLVRVVQSK